MKEKVLDILSEPEELQDKIELARREAQNVDNFVEKNLNDAYNNLDTIINDIMYIITNKYEK